MSRTLGLAWRPGRTSLRATDNARPARRARVLGAQQPGRPRRRSRLASPAPRWQIEGGAHFRRRRRRPTYTALCPRSPARVILLGVLVSAAASGSGWPPRPCVVALGRSSRHRLEPARSRDSLTQPCWSCCAIRMTSQRACETYGFPAWRVGGARRPITASATSPMTHRNAFPLVWSWPSSPRSPRAGRPAC